MANVLFENFLVFLIPIVSIGVALVVLFVKKEYTKTVEILNSQAIKRNGRIIKVFLAYPKLVFNYHTNNAVVFFTPGGKNSPPHTHIKITFNIPITQKMIIYKEGVLSKLGKFFGMQDIQIGIDSFDREVIIKGSDEYFVRSILTIDIQDQILSLVKKKLGPYISLDEKQLELTVADTIRDEHLLDEFINLGLRLIDKIQGKMGYY